MKHSNLFMGVCSYKYVMNEGCFGICNYELNNVYQLHLKLSGTLKVVEFYMVFYNKMHMKACSII